MTPNRKATIDRTLLVEAVLVLVLVGLGIVLYLRPAAGGFLRAEWWHWIVLAALLFGITGFETLRRRRERRNELRRAIREEAGAG